MIRKLKFFWYCFVLIPVMPLFGQSDISMATQWYNRANYNPATIARTDYFYLFSNVRDQWIGVDGAPRVLNFQCSEYVNDLRSAFGFSLTGDQSGVTRSLNPMVSYAYRVSNDRDWALSFGISGGIFTRYINGTLFEAETVNDPSVSYSAEKVVKPDLNAGVEFQTSQYIFGFSSTHLLSLPRADTLFLNSNHRYAYTIYKNTSKELFNYNVGLQIVNRGNLFVGELNGSIRFKRVTGLQSGPREIFDAGLTLRTSRQVTLLFGINVSSNLRVGYAFDQSLVTGYNRNGTHELMLEWRIPCKLASTKFQCESPGYWYR